jgi:tetratricopeptide (TPR) repeat protein
VARPRLSLPAPELLLGALAAAVFILWAADGGGAAETSLYPGSLFLLGLLAVTVFVYWRSGAVGRLPVMTVAALALLGAFVIWSFLSITWADVKGDAWVGANRALTYLIAFAVFAIPPWRRGSAAIVLGLYAIGIAAVGVVDLSEISGSEDPSVSFISGSLIDPTGYHNSTAALYLGAFFPAAFLASRAETPWLLRGPLLAAAGIAVEMAVLAQSRGSAIAFPIALLVYLVLVSGRVRAAIPMLAAAAAAAAAAPSLLDVYPALRDAANESGAIDDAATAVWISCAFLLVAGWALGLADRSISVSERAARVGERAFAIGAAILAVAGIVVALNATGNPADWAEERWDDFKSGYGSEDFGASRFSGSLGSNRYDFWRVAMDEFTDNPVTGVGADNFAADYLRDRESTEEPKHPHSLELRLLGQTGLVGTSLFAGFVVVALIAALRARRAAGRLGAGIAATAVAAFAYWLIHGSADWLWVFPSLTAPVLAWLAMSGRLTATEDLEADPAEGLESEPAEPRDGAARGRGARVALAAAGIAVAIIAAASYLLPLGAAEDVATASSTWGADPEAAFDRLDRASDLNFLSDEPDLVAGAIAERLGDRRRMRDYFEAALERNPVSWYALLELGALDGVEGDRRSALAYLDEAAALNPQEPLIADVERGVRRGREVSLRAIDRAFLSRVCERVGRTADTQFCP